jgi:phospholipid-binding lipoprotein MlaA
MLKSLKSKILIPFYFFFCLISADLFAATSMESFEDEEFESYTSNNDLLIYDPLESFNRKIYTFNDYADRYFIEHVALVYRKTLPKGARSIVRNFITNLTLPISLFNSLLQGNVENSMATFSTFLINSSVGIGGLFDVAGNKNIRYKPEDFGQTLGFYGVKSGPYLVLPILGPSSLRDFSGLVLDKSINPVEFNLLEIGGSQNLLDPYILIGFSALGGIDKRESLIDIVSDIRKESFDPYATIRSAYLQKRNTDIKN